jgi:hypothetical protein
MEIGGTIRVVEISTQRARDPRRVMAGIEIAVRVPMKAVTIPSFVI